MSDREVATKIRDRCMHGDTEMAHADADEIIVELLKQLGYTETVAAWEAVDKWYA